MAGDAASADGADGPTADAPESPRRAARPRLASRVLLTWLEVTVVGITGGVVGGSLGGPPGFVVYLATTLVSVGVIFYNVNELVKAWLRWAKASESDLPAP
jgi:hypothetical protein